MIAFVKHVKVRIYFVDPMQLILSFTKCQRSNFKSHSKIQKPVSSILTIQAK